MTNYDERLKKSDYLVRPVPLRTAQAMVAQNHYAKGGSNTGTFVHGLFRKDDPWKCLGVAWWIPPTKSAALSIHPPAWQKVLALSRLVILPGVPKNAAGFLISQSVKLIQAAGGWEKLVTYADTWQGHTGGIYKATNWTFEGLTTPESTFVDQDGRMVARKAGGHTRTRAEMEAMGCQMVGRFSKLRFTMTLKPPPRRQPPAAGPTQPPLPMETTT